MRRIKPQRVKFAPPRLQHLWRGNQDFLDVWNSRGWGAVHSIKYSAMVIALSNWEKHMAMKTYRIELKMDFNDSSNHEIMLGIAKQYARDLLASAMLLQDGRKPAVALMTDDSFVGPEQIDLMDQSENVHAE